MRDLPSGTVSFLFTDVEGSTRLLQELGAKGYAASLAEQRRVLRAAFARHGGVEVDTQGDAFFVAFPTAPGALAAAAESQQALEVGPIRVRMGLHTGAPLLTEEGYVGMDVHRAARIAAAGHGGQVLVSAATRALVDDAALRDLGEHRLKDLSAPERLYQLGELEFPPLKTLYTTNLPVSTTTFLGREQELREVVGLLKREDVRLLTLTGPGGTGKTRLAVQAAAEAADQFPDGLTWVALSPLREPALLLAAVAQALGVKEEPSSPLADTLVSWLSGRRQLLLLDNAEHLLPAAAEYVVRLREASRVTLLVTSRERLKLQGEQVWAVPPLADEDGVALFAARARALDPSFTATDAARELCMRLDNLPLALELAAARTPLFSLEQLLARLGRRLDLFKGGRDADSRQRTLRATIDWSYTLLTDQERSLFRRLSIFVGGCAFEDAERVCDADPDTLQSLLDKSLIRRRATELGPRFTMLETIREYASEQLEKSGARLLVEDRLIDAVCEFARAAEPAWRVGGDDEWLSRFSLERDNLRYAIRAALARGDGERALTIAVNVGWIWLQLGLMREGMQWINQGLAVAETLKPGLEGYALLVLAVGHTELGEVERALELLDECLPLLETGGLPIDHAFALYCLGANLVELARFDEAEQVLRRAEREALSLGDPTLVYPARNGLADLYASRGDRVRARALLEKGGPAPSSGARAYQLATLAELLASETETARADVLLDEAFAICERGGYQRELAYATKLRGYLHVLAGRREEAVTALEDLRRIGEESYLPGVVGGALLGLAAAEARWGRPETAVELWGCAHALGVAPRPDSWRLDRNLERELLEPLRQSLSADVFAAAWAAGETRIGVSG